MYVCTVVVVYNLSVHALQRNDILHGCAQYKLFQVEFYSNEMTG